MWRGSVYGAGLGILGAASGFLVAFLMDRILSGAGVPQNALSGTGSLALLVLVGACAGPGALIFSVPLQILLTRKRRTSSDRGPLLALALVLGLGFGLLNLATTLLVLVGVQETRSLLDPHRSGLNFLVAAAAGGLGLGLGCFWGLPRPREDQA